VKTSEKQAARTGALPVLTPVMAMEPEGPLEVGEAETPTLTKEKRRLGDVSGREMGCGRGGG
jgi:hypothetical protein